MQPHGHLDFGMRRPVLDFWPTELEENKSELFWATRFVVICYSSKRKPIQVLQRKEILRSPWTQSPVAPHTLQSSQTHWDRIPNTRLDTNGTWLKQFILKQHRHLALFLSLSCSSQSDVQLTFSASTKTDWFISLETTKREGLGHGLSTPALLTFWTRSFFCSGDCSVHCRDA